MCNSASTIRQGVKANTNAKVLKAKLALKWTGLYKVLAVGPCSSAETPECSPLGENLYLDLRSDLPGSDDRWRVAIKCCKPRANPHDSRDMLKYQPAGLTQYVLNNVFKTPPPYPVTQDDVSTPHQRLEVKTINGHESVRDDVASSQSYTRRIGWDSSNHPASGKWTPTSPAHTVCVNGPALQTSTAKPTAFTAAC